MTYSFRAWPLLIAAAALPAAPSVNAQLNPFSILGEVVTTAMDVRTKDEAKNDIAISTSASKRLLDDPRAEWAGVSILIFAQHVVLAGAVKNDEARRIAQEVVNNDPRIRSFANELVVIRKKGDEGSFVQDKTIDTKINASLTGTEGIASVNMRWKTVNGNVVLMGVARSRDEADLTIAKIREVEGVKRVKSRLRVVPKS